MHSCPLQLSDVPEPEPEEEGSHIGLALSDPQDWLHTVKGELWTQEDVTKASIPAKTWMYPHKGDYFIRQNTCKVYLHGTDTEWGRLAI